MFISVTTNSFKTNSIIQTKNITTVSFKGNDTFEKTKSNGIGLIIHQTNFFREPKTDEFVYKYILDKSKDEDNIKIVSAACSTGEEVLSYSMLLDDIKDKTEITGFDIDEKSIAQAKNGTYKVKNIIQTINDWDTPLNQEGFLIDETSALTEHQKYAKEKFYQYFSPVGEKEIEKVRLKDKLAIAIANLFSPILGTKLQPRKTETQLFKAKEGTFKNCNFMTGDILNTSKMFKPESVNLFLFRNALYHLVCKDYGGMQRIMKPDSEDTIKNIATQIYDCLKPDGLLVFGEKEGIFQGIDKVKLYDILTAQGFVPVYNKKDVRNQSKQSGASEKKLLKYMVNIWKKPVVK